jgi:hypothetical protein
MKIFGSDFDDCILKGDVADGSKDFIGVIEYLYSKTGLDVPEELRMIPSASYPTFEAFNEVYLPELALNNTNGYLIPLEAFQGQDEKVRYWAEKHWQDTLQYYLIPEIVALLKKKSRCYDIYIISGSPTIYIEPVQNYLPFKVTVLSVELDKIITTQIGKVTRLKKVSPLTNVAGYIGETWKNDGPLLATLANENGSQNLYFVCHNDAQCDKNAQLNICRYGITKICLPTF